MSALCRRKDFCVIKLIEASVVTFKIAENKQGQTLGDTVTVLVGYYIP